MSYCVTDVESYELVGKGKQCSRNTTYTLHGCDGWARVSLDDCKKKCSNNESPGNCQKGHACRYVIWDPNPDWLPGWCHLASDSCNIVLDGNPYSMHELWLKDRSASGKNHSYLCHLRYFFSFIFLY